jgi:hypothetical protein
MQISRMSFALYWRVHKRHIGGVSDRSSPGLAQVLETEHCSSAHSELMAQQPATHCAKAMSDPHNGKHAYT